MPLLVLPLNFRAPVHHQQLGDAVHAIIRIPDTLEAEHHPLFFITADDVTLGKPNPEPYILAANRLGLEPKDCVVFEDSPNGIKAAKQAGMRVIAIAVRSADHNITEADYVVHDLTWITLRVKPDSSLELTLQSAEEV